MKGLLEGRVAVITGAGRGLGRAYALALSRQGARVVVNDLGVGSAGLGVDASIAQAVVDEIRAEGGAALASGADVSDPAEAHSVVEDAIREYGRLDILINNAGIIENKLFEEYLLTDFERLWRVHVGGSINLVQAAWPLMQAQRYGRIILTESAAGLYGLRGQAAYAAAKGAVHGLMKVLAIEARDFGIKVNAISPGGFSRMHEEAITDSETLEHMRKIMPVELVAPAAVWLSSEACDVSGETFAVWSGRVARVAMGTGKGFYDPELTASAIAENYSKVADISGFYEPVDALDEVNAWFEGRFTDRQIPG